MTKADFNQVTNNFNGSYVKTIFDYVQTHALYGVAKSECTRAKEELKKIGATSFRVVNNGFGFSIICFRMK